MNLHLLYAAIDGANIAFLSVLAIRLVTLEPRNRNVQLIVLLAFCTVCAVVSARHSYVEVLPAEFAVDLGPLIVPMNLARNLTSGVVMLLCHSIFQDRRRLPPPLLAVWAVQMSLEEPLEWMVPPAWEQAQPLATFVVFEVVPSALQLVMLGFALIWVLRESDADLVEARRKTRAVLVVLTVAQIVLALLVERLALQIWALPIDVFFPVHAGIIAFGLLLSGAIILLLLRPDSVRFVDPRRPTPVDTVTDASRQAYDVARIRAAFESERVYRRRGLTVGALAKHLKIPEYRLRALIHNGLGYRNFNTLLHDYRVAEVSEALADPSQDDTLVLTLALAAGYDSISPFNRAFRTLKGMTPTQFRVRSRQKLADS